METCDDACPTSSGLLASCNICVNLIMITLVYYFVGSKFWKSTRKIKVISQSDYSAFRGMKKMKMPEFSDSDSDFETIAPKKRQCIDSTAPDDGSSMGSLMSRMENLGKCVQQSLGHHEEQEKLKKTITTLESEKARLIEGKRGIERSLDDFKNSLSCIVCKSLANFPWQVTP